MKRSRLAVVLGCVVAISTTARAQVGSSQSAPTMLTLEEALQYALDHYPSLRAALEQVNAAAANVSVAKSASLPPFDSGWQPNRARANHIFGQRLPRSVIPSLSGRVLPAASGQGVWGSAAGGLLS